MHPTPVCQQLRACVSEQASEQEEKEEGYYMLWPVNKTDHTCQDIKVRQSTDVNEP